MIGIPNKISFTLITGWFLILLCLSDASAQVTIKVSKIPKNTPPGDSIFISGTFNNWNTKDAAIRLILQNDSTYSITFSPPNKYFEYKFTRGDWSNVEGDKNGNTIPNRVLTHANSPVTIEASIETWIDLETIKIRIVNLPSNTPHNAPLYLTGPFNHWNPADPNYKLEHLENGTYQYVLPHWDSLSFKFTRGSFQSIESNASGDPISARKFIPSKLKSKTIEYRIDGWEDLSETKGNLFESILMLAGCLGVFVTLALHWIRNSKKQSNTLLSILLIVISLALIIRIFLQYQYFYYQAPKLVLFPLFLLFAISPLLNFYAKSIFHQSESIGLKEFIIVLTPLVILMIGLMPLLISDKNHLVTMLLNHELDNNFKVVCGIGILYNIYYLYDTIILLKSSAQEDGLGPNQRSYYSFITSILLIGSIIIFILTITVFISIESLKIPIANKHDVFELGITLCWLSLCLFPFVIVWFAIVRPEIFSQNFEVDKGKIKDVLSVLKLKLDELMDNKKPYLDPELSLKDLAERLQTNTHTLSRLIHENNSINFYDFINHYRITEFKKRVENGQHKTKTIIAIANEVGFKSKTTFNRTFKKLNEVTPRDYLHTLKVENS